MDHTKYSQRDHQGKGVVKFNVLKVKEKKWHEKHMTLLFMLNVFFLTFQIINMLQQIYVAGERRFSVPCCSGP